MEVYVELIIVFVFACLLTLMYVFKRQRDNKPITIGIFAMVAWFSVAMLYLICEPVGHTVALVYLGIGLVFFVLTITDTVYTLQKQPEPF